MENNNLSLLKGVSTNRDEAKAVQELYEMINQPNSSGVFFFCSSKYDLDRLAGELTRHFTCPLIGCTTTGEITPFGIVDHSITGVSFPSSMFKITPYFISSLNTFNFQEAAKLARDINNKLEIAKEENPNNRTFGFLLIDGLSQMEERVLAYLSETLTTLPIFGGSAADDLSFKETFVFKDGQFTNNTAVLALVETSLPFTVFKTQHFVETDHKLVITDADPDNRLVKEINGEPAAWEYARLLRIEIEDLTPTTFSKYPVMLKIGGEYYVRSIINANNDGTLTFACAIDSGLVLTIAKGVDLVQNLNESFNRVTQEISNTQLIIGCDCAWRKLEINEKGINKQVSQLFINNNVIGFHTYGEQFNSIHVNQTFTGVAIGGLV